jgi:hypothetical protein
MILELFDNINYLDERCEGDTYHSTLFPEPAAKTSSTLLTEEEKGGGWGTIRTFTMYPQKGTHCFPFLEGVTLDKPGGSSIVVSCACNVVVCRWIGRGEPDPNIPLQLIAYGAR